MFWFGHWEVVSTRFYCISILQLRDLSYNIQNKLTKCANEVRIIMNFILFSDVDSTRVQFRLFIEVDSTPATYIGNVTPIFYFIFHIFLIYDLRFKIPLIGKCFLLDRDISYRTWVCCSHYWRWVDSIRFDSTRHRRGFSSASVLQSRYLLHRIDLCVWVNSLRTAFWMASAIISKENHSSTRQAISERTHNNILYIRFTESFEHDDGELSDALKGCFIYHQFCYELYKYK